MPVYSFEGLIPVVHPTAFVHPAAVLIGDVTVGAACYIGPGASLRGDFGRIVVEPRANIQDNCTLHCGADLGCFVGGGATIGHGAVLHGCRIGANALIGMNAVILDGAEIGEECLVAALSLVKSDARALPRRLWAGNPARPLRALSADEIVWRADGDSEYERLTRRCFTELKVCDALTAAEPNRPRLSSTATAVRIGAAGTKSRPVPVPDG